MDCERCGKEIKKNTLMPFYGGDYCSKECGEEAVRSYTDRMNKLPPARKKTRRVTTE